MRSFRRHLLGHAIEFDSGAEEESCSVELPDKSSDPQCNVLCEVECSESSVEEWDELEDDNIRDRVALFLARLKSKSSQTFSGIRDVVEHP